METLLLIDGNAIIHRAFYAIPQTFRTSKGVLTNAVYGFLAILHKSITDFNPDHVIICFDTPKPTFRKQLHIHYQAHRPKMSDELKDQIPLIKEMVDKAGITHIEKEGFEADDLIGTIVTKYKKNHKILILTGDKDIMQLVDEYVYVISPQTGVNQMKLYDINEVKNKLGVLPYEIPDLKALMGDQSDNYQGAKGIGPKTAIELLKQFGTIEHLLKHADEIENKRIRQLIHDHKDHILLSKQLATIICNVDIHVDTEKAKFTSFNNDLKEFLDGLQMRSLIDRVFKKSAEPIMKTKKKEKLEIDQGSLFS